MENLINFEWLQDEAFKFVCSRSFMMATAVFVAYLVVVGIVRRVFDVIGTIFWMFFGIFSPLRMRQIFFNGITLLFITASFAAYQGGNAKLAGKEGVWEAVVGGAGGVALWSVFMLVAHLYREHKTPSAEVVRKKRPAKSVSRFSRVIKGE